MRKQKETFYLSAEIEETNALLKAIERKMPPEIIKFCRVDWGHNLCSGSYEISFDYFSNDTVTKSVHVGLRAGHSQVYIKVVELDYWRKEDYRRDERVESYKEFTSSDIDEKISWDKRVKKTKQEAVKYTVDKIASYFGSNAERFINSI